MGEVRYYHSTQQSLLQQAAPEMKGSEGETTAEQKEQTVEQEKRDEVEQSQEAEAKDPRDEKIEMLEKLVEELKYNWKLALADAENIKKIAMRDVEKARDFGVEKLVKQLMGVLDTIEITLRHKPDFNSEEHKDNKIAEGAFKTLEAINKQMMTIFSNYHLVEVRPQIGDQFDPMLHNALFEVDPPEGANAPPGTIGLIVKNGWKRKDALIRYATRYPPLRSSPHWIIDDEY